MSVERHNERLIRHRDVGEVVSRCLLDFFFSSRRRHTRLQGDWSSDVCSSDLSFPSGHSSSSFAGLFYLSLYLAAKLHVLDQRGEVWRTVIVLIPTLAASLIAGDRKSVV